MSGYYRSSYTPFSFGYGSSARDRVASYQRGESVTFSKPDLSASYGRGNAFSSGYRFEKKQNAFSFGTPRETKTTYTDYSWSAYPSARDRVAAYQNAGSATSSWQSDPFSFSTPDRYKPFSVNNPWDLGSRGTTSSSSWKKPSYSEPSKRNFYTVESSSHVKAPYTPKPIVEVVPLNRDEFQEEGQTFHGSWRSDFKVGTHGDDTFYGKGGDDCLNGKGGNDWIDGGHGNDILSGGYGDDTIYGGTGDDVLSGGRGNDILIGGQGKDRIDGGHGVDTVDYSSRHEDIEVTLRGERRVDVLIDGRKEDTISGIENVIGGSGDDILEGDGQDNRLEGGDGNDILIGGKGDDTLVGGKGIDGFAYDFDSYGDDTILDFNQAEGDYIDLQTAGWRGHTLSWNDKGEPQRYGVWMEQNEEETVLYADTDGDGTEDFSITLLGVSSLDSDSVVF